MREYVVQGSLGLAHGTLLRIEDGQDILLYVWEGEVWLTEDGERHDRILRAGEWHRVERNGAAVAYALQRATVTLTAPEPSHYARRIVLVRPGSPAPVALYDAALEGRGGATARARRFWAALFASAARPTTASL
jgi:hypothetical protein